MRAQTGQKGGGREEWRRRNIRQERWWEMEDVRKERALEEDLQDTRQREKDDPSEMCRQPQRRIRLTNCLLLHYRGCHHGPLCQLSCTLTPVTPHAHKHANTLTS